MCIRDSSYAADLGVLVDAKQKAENQRVTKVIISHGTMMQSTQEPVSYTHLDVYKRQAHILGIVGWVRNNGDGSVEVLAHGARDQLSGLRSRLREGPRAARVDAVEEFEARPVAGINSFRIEGAW